MIPRLSLDELYTLYETARTDFDISRSDMMAQAGALFAEELIRQDFEQVVLCVGTGYSAAAGLVCVQVLQEEGIRVEVFLAQESDHMNEVAHAQWSAATEEGVAMRVYTDDDIASLQAADVVIDALLDVDASDELTGMYVEMVAAINTCSRDVYSLGVPSGLGEDTDPAAELVVHATRTYAFGLPMAQLDQRTNVVGKLYAIDIGLPQELFEQLDMEVPYVFDEDPVVPIDEQIL